VAVTLACIVAGILGLTGVALVDGEPSEQAVVQPAVIAPGVETSTPVWGDAASGNEQDSSLAHTSFATRHVPTQAESEITGALHPATDRVMTLMIGWMLLAILGGGLLAGGARAPRFRHRQGTTWGRVLETLRQGT
jgi:hypothetical protein